jgi:GxxExxY protein
MSGDRGDDAGASLDALTRRVIEAIIRVHSVLGPGFLETVYQRALAIELTRRGVPIKTEWEINIDYEGDPVGKHRLDLVVADRVIVELKTVEELAKAHYAQVRSYLKATRLPVALLVNFSKEKADFRRVDRV